jgi:DnaA-homolog protein
MISISTPQLPLDLVESPPQSLDNFVPGRNAEVLGVLRRLTDSGIRLLLLWGEAGAGKTHLLKALVNGDWDIPAAYCAQEELRDGFSLTLPSVLAFDDVDRLDVEGQRALFNLVNRIHEEGGILIAAASQPPAQLALRADLTTRLGSGLVYRIQPLADADKRKALQSVAHARGFMLPDAALDYLLNHCPRDLPWLMQALARIDHDSLAAQKQVTLPLIRALFRI